jgi:hypothetical protein
MPPLPLDPVERRIERALLHAQRILRHLHNALTDPVTVERPERECLKDQHVERSLQQFGVGLGIAVLLLSS